MCVMCLLYVMTVKLIYIQLFTYYFSETPVCLFLLILTLIMKTFVKLASSENAAFQRNSHKMLLKLQTNISTSND